MWNRTLICAAHPDDDIIGCGGCISLISKFDNSEVRTVYFSNGVGSRGDVKDGEIEQRLEAMQKANEIVGAKGIEVGLFEDQRFDQYPIIELTKWVSRFIDDFKPTTVFTHSSADINRDHRCVNEAVRTACRPLPGSSISTLLFFEVLSSTEWGDRPFNPTVFIASDIAKKAEALKCYDFEMIAHPHPRNVNSIMHRSIEHGQSVGKLAVEGFELGRMVLA